MATKKAEGVIRLLLKIKGASEDVPRELSAVGPGCSGHYLYVCLPTLDKAMLIHAEPPPKGSPRGTPETAHVWRTDLGLAPSHHPETAIDIKAAVEEARALREAVSKAGPTMLRGAWKGVFICDGSPHVELERKIVSYGTLKLVSGADGRWTATFEREARWFAGARAETVSRSGLAAAVTAGYGLAMGIVAEACAVRDTRRRGALDTSAPAVKPRRDGLDAPVSRFIAKRTGVPLLSSVKVPDPCPTCEDGMTDAVKAAGADAKRLASGAVNLDDVKDAPKHLTRAASLIRRAGVLLESPMCQPGEDKSAAKVALGRAVAAYNEARVAFEQHQDADIALVQRLRTIAEQVALAAAKTGRSCAGTPARRIVPKRVTYEEQGSTAHPPSSVRRTRAPAGDKAQVPTGRRSKQDKDAIIGAAVSAGLRDLVSELRSGAA